MDCRVAVCCLSRHRPEMLAELMASFAALTKPGDTETVFIIVENDTEPRSQTIVERVMRGQTFEYLLEPAIGISRARNRAVEAALSHSVDAILFVDDDETVEVDWLLRLLEAWKAGLGDILGGPVKVRFEKAPENIMERFLQRGLQQRFARRAARKARHAANGKPQHLRLCTNNCLIDSNIFAKSGLRFNEARLSGEDGQLFLEASLLGYRKGWVEHAVVHETWPASRVSLRYWFFRAREHASSSKLSHASTGSRWLFKGLDISISLGMGTLAFAQMLFLPLTGAGGTLQAVRNLGISVGYMQRALGREGRPYDKITGS